eukprot:TRINITY_DN15179_c0_g1_i1.p1 TRINITY_DN15179_c0_g1~~TRINITY_DN15179_c0_g1_i1.p1  ORF type:complete len:352 (+),score=85.20 TRINITY_DN15179_c0_g1_i1:63-1118(+)
MPAGEVCRAAGALLVVWACFLVYVYAMRAGAETLAREREWGMSATLTSAFFLLGFGLIIVGAYADIIICFTRTGLRRCFALDAHYASVVERVTMIFAVVAYLVAGSVVVQPPTSDWLAYQDAIDVLALGDAMMYSCPYADPQENASIIPAPSQKRQRLDAGNAATVIVLDGTGWTLDLQDARSGHHHEHYYYLAPVVHSSGRCAFDPPVYAACMAETSTPTLSSCEWWLSSSADSSVTLLQVAYSTHFESAARSMFLDEARGLADAACVFDYQSVHYRDLKATVARVDQERGDMLMRLLLEWLFITLPFLVHGIAFLRSEAVGDDYVSTASVEGTPPHSYLSLEGDVPEAP